MRIFRPNEMASGVFSKSRESVENYFRYQYVYNLSLDVEEYVRKHDDREQDCETAGHGKLFRDKN